MARFARGRRSPAAIATARRLLVAMVLAWAAPTLAAETKLGLTISVDGDGFFLNPVVKHIVVTGVAKASLAEAAGIAVGDEIVRVEGQAVAGRRARELQGYLTIEPGQTRTLQLTHPNGDSFEARLTKPKE